MANGDSWAEVKALMEATRKSIENVRKLAEEAKAANGDALKADELKRAEADLASKLEERAKVLEERIDQVEAKANRPGAPGGPREQTAAEHKSAFLDYMRNPRDWGTQQKLAELQGKATDVRTTTNASGGFAVPEEIAREIAKQVQDVSPIRQIARVVSVGTSDYKELVNLNGATTEWVGETATRSQTNTPDLGEVAPSMGMLAAYPQATVESLEDLFFDVAGWLTASVGEEFAIAEGQAFVAGNGTNKPTGFLNGTPVATADAGRAFGTLQYIPTGEAAALSGDPFDELIDIKMTLKAGYRPNARWVMSSTTQAALAKTKDADGQYLLQPSLVAGTPDTMIGSPVTVAEDMPAIGADAFPIAYGDWTRGYLIVDRSGLRIVRDEVTTPGYVKWQVFRRLGGAVKDSNAIKLLKVAAS